MPPVSPSSFAHLTGATRPGHGVTDEHGQDPNRLVNTFHWRQLHPVPPSPPPRPPPKPLRLIDRMTYASGPPVSRAGTSHRNEMNLDRFNIRDRADTTGQPIPYGSGMFSTRIPQTRASTQAQAQSQAAVAAPLPTPRITTRKAPASIAPITMFNCPLRGNTYRGEDPIKRAVQNPRLRRVLAGKRPPAKRRNPDRPLIKWGSEMGGLV